MSQSYFRYLLVPVMVAIPLSAWSLDERLRFRATLSGAQEVTTSTLGVSTTTTGIARVEFDKALSKATIRVSLSNGRQIVAASLRCAPAGVATPTIAVTLFSDADGRDVNGDLPLLKNPWGNEDISDVGDDPACGVPLNNIASLAFAMKAGRVYVHVADETHRSGLIRGQLLEPPSKK